MNILRRFYLRWIESRFLADLEWTIRARDMARMRIIQLTTQVAEVQRRRIEAETWRKA